MLVPQQISRDPQVQRTLTTLQAKLPAFLTLKHAAIGSGLVLLLLVFLLGFSRVLMLISFTMIILTGKLAFAEVLVDCEIFRTYHSFFQKWFRRI